MTKAINPKMTKDPARRLVLDQSIAISERTMSKAISDALACVARVPVRPTKKIKQALPRGSREWRNVYAEIMVMTGQTRVMGATEPPTRRAPRPGAAIMTMLG
jgi:hypothetical protein